jgi:alkanesulfonate monooxygenase SsuD/methylene tetrahydromethanopterin reductase-like flavin-dependent oxidoreductase (luciferase family)
MKLGLGLPNWLYPCDRHLLVEWARIADAAGFHELSVVDRVNSDVWEPLATLAVVAGVTERIRLASTIVQLPNRNEVLVAKQAAVIDQTSGGRLDLGVAIGHDEDDYEVLGPSFRDRAERFGPQIAMIRSIWEQARASNETRGVLGPPPVQEPGPPIWIGATSDRGRQRALELGDGYIFGGDGPDEVARTLPALRKKRKKAFTIAGLAYVAIADDPDKALDVGSRQILRYYDEDVDTAGMLLHGPASVVAEAVKAYENAGLDLLFLLPSIPDLAQVERLAEDVLPPYRV